MWLNEPLNDVLSSRSKVAVLRVLAAAPAPLNGREIARRAFIAPGHAHRVLADLVAAGLVLSRDQGRVNTYEFADPDSLLTRRLKELFAAEATRRRQVIERLSKEVKGVLSVVLFGSETRSEARPGSDTDLLIVVAKQSRALDNHIRDTCVRLAAEHQLALSWLVVGMKELRDLQARGNGLWASIQSEGVRLAGKPLERLLSDGNVAG